MLFPLPGDPTRLLVAGDTHGNYLHWKNVLLPAAREHQVDGIVQLGDFGYWPLTGDGRDYLAWLSSELDDAESWIVFVDGNHEDHKALRKLPARPDGFVEVTDRILWAPRGHRWTWQGVRFLALGGAYSIDRHDRKLDSGRWGWFREEILTRAEADKAVAGGPCDVLLTHDAPEITTSLLMPHSIMPGGYTPPAARITSKLIQEVAEATRPGLILHGHWHHSIDSEVPLGGPIGFDPNPTTCRVIGLACDEMANSFCILDLPGLDATHEPASQPDPNPFASLVVFKGESGLAGYRVADVEGALMPEQLADFGRWLRGQGGMIHPTEGPMIFQHDCERWLRVRERR